MIRGGMLPLNRGRLYSAARSMPEVKGVWGEFVGAQSSAENV